MSLSIASIASLTSEADRYITANRRWEADNIQHYIDDEGMEDKLIVQVCHTHLKLKKYVFTV